MKGDRIHHMSCSMVSVWDDEEDRARVDKLIKRLETFARKLGFQVMSEAVDKDD